MVARASEALCVHFGVSDGIHERLRRSKSKTKLIVDFILITRKLNYIITFNEIYQIVPYNYKAVLLELSIQGKYVEMKEEEIINRYLFQCNLSYREGCIAKYFLSCLSSDVFLDCICALILTLRILSKNVNIEMFNQDSFKIKQMLNRVKTTKFPIKRLNNHFAEETLSRYVWNNEAWLPSQVF